jgi:hypothetical protein
MSEIVWIGVSMFVVGWAGVATFAAILYRERMINYKKQLEEMYDD